MYVLFLSILSNYSCITDWEYLLCLIGCSIPKLAQGIPPIISPFNSPPRVHFVWASNQWMWYGKKRREKMIAERGATRGDDDSLAPNEIHYTFRLCFPDANISSYLLHMYYQAEMGGHYLSSCWWDTYQLATALDKIGFVTSVPTTHSFLVMPIRSDSPHNLK